MAKRVREGRELCAHKAERMMCRPYLTPRAEAFGCLASNVRTVALQTRTSRRVPTQLSCSNTIRQAPVSVKKGALTWTSRAYSITDVTALFSSCSIQCERIVVGLQEAMVHCAIGKRFAVASDLHAVPCNVWESFS